MSPQLDQPLDQPLDQQPGLRLAQSVRENSDEISGRRCVRGRSEISGLHCIESHAYPRSTAHA